MLDKESENRKCDIAIGEMNFSWLINCSIVISFFCSSFRP